MIKDVAFGIVIAFLVAAFLLWKFWPLAILFIFLIALGKASSAAARKGEEQ